jgi:inosose dehydratase
MKAAINVWTWGINAKEQFEQGLKEVSDIGYDAVENISSIVALFEDNPAEFDELLARYGVKLVCAYHHLSGDFAKDRANAERYLRFLQGRGPKVMNLQAGRRPEGGPSPELLAETARQVREIAELGQRYGITVCLHPHYATNVERAPELEYMMEQIPADVLGLTLDTAHTVLGGMDPVETFERYAARVRYVHMKDIALPIDPQQPWWSHFRELGRGVINFPAIARILRRAGFEGYLCVELDAPRVCGYKSAAISRQYLRDELGI